MALQTEVVYRYFLTDLLTNQVIAEVPFKGVSYERVNRRAGGFSGSIPFIPVTNGLDLYDATMPGRTGLYVMRNGVCVWGGIVWSRSYSVSDRNLSVEASEFTSYFYHRYIWQTIQYGSNFFMVSTWAVSNKVGQINLSEKHNFKVGDKVKIGYVSPLVDGVQTVKSVSTNSLSFTFDTENQDGSGANSAGAVRSLVDNYDFIRDLLYRMETDLGGLNFSNEYIKPAKEYQSGLLSAQRYGGGSVQFVTSTDHGLIPGQEVELLEVGYDLDGPAVVTKVPSSKTFEIEVEGPDFGVTLPGNTVINVTKKSLTDGIATVTLERPHYASIGQEVFLDGIDAFFTGRLDTTFNGRFEIVATPTANSISFQTGSLLNVAEASVQGGTATFGSKAVYGDYGSFTANSSIGLDFLEPFDTLLSGAYQDTQVLRGFEMKSVGEILEEYSNTTKGGFDYRIDCDFSYDTNQFVRTLWLSAHMPATSPAGVYYTAAELGADQLVFEYPGNISNFTIDESAEDAATRFFVVGNIEDLTDDASQPYAGASALDFLDNPVGRSWPLLDQAEKLDKVEDELSLYDYAQDYLFESLPPIGTYSIQVNGSLAPIVGSYQPGQWCSIVIDDDFVRARLASDQEPDEREGVLIRKINSIKVNVPDSPTFPETVDLELITDWKVDKNNGE